ncbi:MAG TPA: serine/threonine dehydratase [Acidimicrobiales bacterium]|nr:serine/threonine dehydratase [Acidimicrobiales bacterium]
MNAPPPPDLPSRADIDAAATRLAPFVRRTPIVEVDAADLGLPGRRAPLILKLELTQHAGSFKARGAHAQLLADDLPAAGVVAASGGNYGVAIAYTARRLGVAATVCVPDTTAPAKLDRLRGLGAAVEVVPGLYDDALAASRELAATTGARLLHAFDQVEMLLGSGSLARELSEQALLDRVVVAVGGGGLIGGVACWFRGDVAVTGVETEGCDTLAAARRAGKPVDVEVSGLGADALGARRAGELGFAAAQRWVDDVVVVPDEALVDAQRRLWSALRIATEPAGAAALAALTTGALADADERAAVILCGANVDPVTLAD